MNAVPKRWSTWTEIELLGRREGRPVESDLGNLRPINWHPGAEGIIIDCEIVQPPSMVGRTVSVHIRGEEVEWLLKELRDVAIARRAQPMEGAPA